MALCQTHTDSAGCDQVWAPWGVAVDCNCNVLTTSNGNSKITTYTQASGYAMASVSARLPTVPYSMVVANCDKAARQLEEPALQMRRSPPSLHLQQVG